MLISLRRNKDEYEIKLEAFAKKQWQKTRAYLIGRYSLSEDECADIFQDSLVILWKNINKKKVNSEDLGLSSSTYFLTICRNKTMELLRSKSKYVTTSYEINPNKDYHVFLEDQVEKILSLENTHENIQKEKEALVRDIVKNLPSPCNELLWGYYGDGYSMKKLAEKLNYANENTVKVTKHRCCEKFRIKYTEMSKSLF